MIDLLSEEELIDKTFIQRNIQGDVWVIKITDFFTFCDKRYIKYNYRSPKSDHNMSYSTEVEIFNDKLSPLIYPYDEHVNLENMIYFSEVSDQFWRQVYQKYPQVFTKYSDEQYRNVTNKMIQGNLRFNISTGETIFRDAVVDRYEGEEFTNYNGECDFYQAIFIGFIEPMLVADSVIGDLQQYL